MSENNTFTTEETNQIGEILNKAWAIKDKDQRADFVENACGHNLIMFEYVIEGLEEMEFGEKGFFNPELEGGTKVGNYTIIEKINQGGLASVYCAEHKVLKTLAAIKVFDKLDVKNIENDLFWNTDHSSLSRFNHDNIVKLYDVGFYSKDGNRLPYIAVEFVKGKHLDKYCKSKDLAIREVLKLFQDLCEVIEFVHDKEKLLHLDLKPDNILVTADRPHRIKLIDFGSSKLFRGETTQFTRSDLLNPLTLKYAPPEQFDQNEVLNNQSDIYSLGVILYLLITEKLPFGEGDRDKKTISQAVTDVNLRAIAPSKRILDLKEETKFGLPIPTLSKVVSGDLDSIILKALEKRRRNRYQTVDEFRRDIDSFLKGKPVKAGPKGFRVRSWIFQVLGFKGGLVGRDRWRSPLMRLSVAALAVALIATFTIIYLQLRAASDPSIGKRMERSGAELTTSAYDQEGGTTTALIPKGGVLNYYCGPKGQDDVCFTFIQIPAGPFTMGLQGNERFSSKIAPVDSALSPKPAEVKQLGPKPPFSVPDGVSAKPNLSEKPDEEEKTPLDENYAKPARNVEITHNFYMAKFEVTNKQWNLVAKTPMVRTELEATNSEDALPKTNVSYLKAVEFCDRLKAELNRNGQKVDEVRLPSEAEWEYACRAESKKLGGNNIIIEKKYHPDAVNALIPDPKTPPWGMALMKKVNIPLPESTLLPNTYGLVGMNGNVWELVADAWHPSYSGAPTNQLPWENPSLSADKMYVLRGGAYDKEAYMTQCSYRKSESNTFVANGQVGFRVVLITKDN